MNWTEDPGKPAINPSFDGHCDSGRLLTLLCKGMHCERMLLADCKATDTALPQVA